MSSTHFCIVCAREFRPATADAVKCPACGGPPEAPAQGQGTILWDIPQVTVPSAVAGPLRPQETMLSESEPRYCIVCAREFRPATAEVVKCPACGGPPERVVSPKPVTEIEPKQTEVVYPTEKTRVEWNEGDLILQEYRIKHVLGEGGFGKVYLVESERTGATFAVKRVRLQFDENRRFEDAYKNLIDELQVWVDLPPFPHVLPCRFFRTVEDEIVIFTDYAEERSLKDWINDGHAKLYADGPDQALQRILDFSIQFARGLHFLHTLGYVHKDVKPGNALVTAKGVVQVSDFGLVRAKGCTATYAAPEQDSRLGRQIDHRTDIWCWGVSVLEMFTGEVTWKNGSIAASVLEMYLADPPADLPRMPDEVADVLRKCFQDNPEDRWSSALEAAEALRQVYEARFGPFPRPLPSFPKRQTQFFSRKVEGAQWNDPLPYLRRALEATGRNSVEAERFATDRNASLRSQAVADLACYQETLRVYAQVNREDSLLLADLYANQALVQQFLADVPGALLSFEQAIRFLEKIVHEQDQQEYISKLAQAYGNKGFQLALNREYEAAIQLYDKTIGILEPYLSAQLWREELVTLIAAYNNKALALSELRRNREASTTFQQAVRFLELLADKTQHPRVLNLLAMTLSNQAKSLIQEGRYLEAIPLCDRAIALQEDLLFRQSREEIAEDIASSYTNKAGALHYLGRYDETILWLDKAIVLYEELITQKGQHHLSSTLSLLYADKANALARLYRVAEALSLYDKAIALSEPLVQQEGRWDLVHEHAQNCLAKSRLLQRQGQEQEALHLVEQALHFLERLVQHERRLELADDLAEAYRLKATLIQKQNSAFALQLYDQAIQLVEQHAPPESWLSTVHRVTIILDKGALLEKTGRLPDALAMYAKAIEALEPVVQKGGSTTINKTLADILCRYAEALRKARRYQESVQTFERAIVLYQERSSSQHIDSVIALAGALHGKAFVLDEMGNYSAALTAYEQAIQRLVTLSDHPECALLLARAQINKSATLARMQEFGEAISLLKEARRVLEKCADANQLEIAVEIARACNDQGFILDELQRFDEALSLYERAIEIREHLIYQRQHHESLPDLIVAYNNKAFALLHHGQSIQALSICDKAIAAGEGNWALEGELQIRLMKELSVSYHRKATILARRNDYDEAAMLYEKSIQYLKPVVLEQGRWEFCFGLANVMANRAFCLFQMGRHGEGQRTIECALDVIDTGLKHHPDPNLMMLRQQIQNMRRF